VCDLSYILQYIFSSASTQQNTLIKCICLKSRLKLNAIVLSTYHNNAHNISNKKLSGACRSTVHVLVVNFL
jgi:hypothetical protein